MFFCILLNLVTWYPPIFYMFRNHNSNLIHGFIDLAMWEVQEMRKCWVIKLHNHNDTIVDDRVWRNVRVVIKGPIRQSGLEIQLFIRVCWAYWMWLLVSALLVALEDTCNKVTTAVITACASYMDRNRIMVNLSCYKICYEVSIKFVARRHDMICSVCVVLGSNRSVHLH